MIYLFESISKGTRGKSKFQGRERGFVRVFWTSDFLLYKCSWRLVPKRAGVWNFREFDNFIVLAWILEDSKFWEEKKKMVSSLYTSIELGRKDFFSFQSHNNDFKKIWQLLVCLFSRQIKRYYRIWGCLSLDFKVYGKLQTSFQINFRWDVSYRVCWLRVLRFDLIRTVKFLELLYLDKMVSANWFH